MEFSRFPWISLGFTEDSSEIRWISVDLSRFSVKFNVGVLQQEGVCGRGGGYSFLA